MSYSVAAEGQKTQVSLNEHAINAVGRLAYVVERLVSVKNRLIGNEPEPAGAEGAPSPMPHLQRSLNDLHSRISDAERELDRIEKHL